MSRHHKVEQVKIESGVLSLTVDGQAIERPLAEVSCVLAEAPPDAQPQFEVSPSGYGIHWPMADEDLSFDGLLGIEHRPEDVQESA